MIACMSCFLLIPCFCRKHSFNTERTVTWEQPDMSRCWEAPLEGPGATAGPAGCQVPGGPSPRLPHAFDGGDFLKHLINQSQGHIKCSLGRAQGMQVLTQVGLGFTSTEKDDVGLLGPSDCHLLVD